MSGSSLRDQLLGLGLAKEKPKKSPKSRKRPRPKPVAGEDISLAQAYAARQRDEKQTAERSAQAKRLEAQRRKQLNDAVAGLALPAAQNVADAPEGRFFEYMGKIRKIYVTDAQQSQLNEGRLGIVSLRGRYLLLEPAVVQKVAKIKPDAVALDPQKPENS